MLKGIFPHFHRSAESLPAPSKVGREVFAVHDWGNMSKPLRQHHFIVVDDEPITASTLAMILRSEGFEARSFTNPFEALQAVLSLPPDFLITDVMMPLLSGIELAMRVRKDCPHCEVLLFSGYSAAADLHEAALAEGQRFEFLSKPAHPRDLLGKVSEMIVRSTTESCSREQAGLKAGAA